MEKSRITWTDLPENVTSWVEAELRSPVLEWHSQSGGWSPGTADRLVCADGSRAFLKAVHPSLNEMTPQLHRDEIRATRLLGPDVPCAHLLASFDDGDWVALLLEDIEGRHPHAPWREAELRAVLDALDAVAAGTTPVEESSLPDASALYVTAFRGLDHLTPDARADVDPWISERLDELRSRAARAVDVVDGPSLGHADLRADNILVQPDGRVRIVDWPNACRSQPWADGVLLAVNVEVLGGLQDEQGDGVDAAPLITEWARAHGASRDDVLDVLVGMLAYYTWAAAQPPVPGLPTLRRDQGVAARAALRVVRRSWPEASA